MAEGVAQLRTTQYGDGGRHFILVISYLVLPTAPTIESRRFLWIEKKTLLYIAKRQGDERGLYTITLHIGEQQKQVANNEREDKMTGT